MPSEPASIPIAKKSNKVGTPNLYEVFPTMMLTKSKREPTNNIFSMVKVILDYFLFAALFGVSLQPILGAQVIDFLLNRHWLASSIEFYPVFYYEIDTN